MWSVTWCAMKLVLKPFLAEKHYTRVECATWTQRTHRGPQTFRVCIDRFVREKNNAPLELFVTRTCIISCVPRKLNEPNAPRPRYNGPGVFGDFLATEAIPPVWEE